MPSRSVHGIVLLALLALLAGCATAPRSVSTTNRPAAEPAPTVQEESPEDIERRAEAHARFLAGLVSELNQQPDVAAEHYAKSLEADPNNEELALDLSRRFIRQNELDRAAEILERAAESPDSSAMVLSRLGFVHLQAGRTNDAIRVNRQAIQKHPDSIAGYQSLYGLYRQMGQTNEASEVLEEAARLRKPDAAFLVDLATLFLLEDSPRLVGANTNASVRARDALHRAAEQSPTNILVLQKLAQGFRLVGEPERAAEVYLKLLEQFPNVPGLREELAEIYLRSNDNKRAAEQLELILRDQPTNPQVYYYLGAIAHEERRFEEAVEFYRKALVLRPEFQQAYYDIASAMLALDKADEAREYLKRAGQRFQQSFAGEFLSGIACMQLKDYTNALEHFTAAEVIGNATETNRLTHTFYFQLGSAHERAGKIEEAVGYFEKCLAISPRFSQALNYLGYMWAERGTNLDRARKMIEEAVSLDPTNAAYLDSLGWVLFKQGHPQEALPQIEKAIQFMSEPDATLFDHLGDIHAALGQPDKARKAWEKSLEIEPKIEVKKKLSASESAQTPKPDD